MTNEQMAQNDKDFRRSCEKAGIEPTARQASKFRNQKGSAFTAKVKNDN